MSASILVGYATRHGSTQEVAESIAATLWESGLTVPVQPVKQVRTMDGYRAVVLGASLYIGSWLKDAQRFLTKHQTALEKLPVAIFSLGPTRADEGMAKVRASLDASGQVPLAQAGRGGIARRKVLEAVEVFATTAERWNRGKSINQGTTPLIWLVPWGSRS